MADPKSIPALLRALASDCENTDGWEGAAPDLRQAADTLERKDEALREARNCIAKWGETPCENDYMKHDALCYIDAAPQGGGSDT